MGFPGLPNDHFWHFLGKWGWANVKWCEQTLHGYVTEPANTWSNLAYVAVGALLLVQRGRQKPSAKSKREHVFLRIMPWAMIVLGFLSGFYHATNAWITQLGDFLGMYLVASIPLLLVMQQQGFRKAGTIEAYAILVGVTMIGTLIASSAHVPIQGILPLFFIGVIGGELRLRKSAPLKNYRSLYLTLGAFAIAGTCSALDVSRIYCDPQNHLIQGHALWHIFSAIGLYFAAHYCRQRS